MSKGDSIMHRMAILYTQEMDIIKEFISVLNGVFEKNNITISAKKPDEASITDILSSDIVIFGSESEDEPKKIFKEIIRALKGVNLAGRFSAFVSFSKKPVSLVFKNALSDTEVNIFKDELILDSDKINKKFIKSWAEELLKYFKDNVNE